MAGATGRPPCEKKHSVARDRPPPVPERAIHGEHLRARRNPARTLTRRLALSAAVTGLLLGSAGPALADGPTAAGPAGPATPAADSPLAAAKAEAARTGGPVTVDSLTTETTQTVANADGTFTVTSHLQPARVRKDGHWKDVDAALARNGDGTLSPRPPPRGWSSPAGAADRWPPSPTPRGASSPTASRSRSPHRW
ncbi:hypothetical protein ACFQ0M_39340 [Kitasatospora aburaviensis]